MNEDRICCNCGCAIVEVDRLYCDECHWALVENAPAQEVQK